MKHKRNFKALEKRRLKGAQLLSQGKSQSAVARELGVARQTVATWAHRLAEGGKGSLKRGNLGRPRHLEPSQEQDWRGGAIRSQSAQVHATATCSDRLFLETG